MCLGCVIKLDASLQTSHFLFPAAAVCPLRDGAFSIDLAP